MNLNPFNLFRRKPQVSVEKMRSELATARRMEIKARYENSLTTDENIRNWQLVDFFSAKAANSWQVRRTLRMRSRYECANNPYLFGIVGNNASDVIGTGPTLQVTTENKAFNRAYQDAWNEWAQEVEFVEKLTTQHLAEIVDGEGFLVLKSVEELYSSVKLYPVDLEADQFTAPTPKDIDILWVDGLTLHPITGRPTSFSVLKNHPGDVFYGDYSPMKADVISARFVIHTFRKFRPGQVRGIPVFTSSLDLFSELRSYRRAILQKAQIAANLTAVIETEAPADENGAETITPFENIPIDRGTSTTMPGGGKMHQYQTGEPAATYEAFREACLGESCRPLAYPLNLALGTSQKFNFSSAKLDFKNYYQQIAIERATKKERALDHVLSAFHEEAIRVPKLLPRYGNLRVPPHEWHWPGFPTLDEAVETAADINQLNAGTKTWQQFWAARGKDWQEIMAQQAAEKAEMEKFELEFGEPLKKTEKIGEEGAVAVEDASDN